MIPFHLSSPGRMRAHLCDLQVMLSIDKGMPGDGVSQVYILLTVHCFISGDFQLSAEGGARQIRRGHKITAAKMV